MKRVLFVFGLFVSTFAFSQVEEGTLMTRYSTLYEYNTYTDEFEKVSEGWITSYLTCNNDYYFLKIEDGDEGKVFWQYYEENEYGNDVYYTEDNRKVVFDYEDQRIIFYYEFNELEELYTKYLVLSKISKQ